MKLISQYSHIAVILVEPIYGGNVGAIARIMHNFCFSDLRIVGKVPEKNDFYLAMHSEQILENANTYTSLKDAVADLERVIAFSRRVGKTKPIDLSPRQMAKYVHNLPNAKIGLVFGRETYGLTDSEAELCTLRCHFMANPDFPSLNLAQAVALALWEIYALPVEEQQTLNKYYNAARKEEINNIHKYIMAVLHSIGFFQKKETINWDNLIAKMLAQLNPDKIMLYRIRQLFNRINVLVTGKGLGYNSDIEAKPNAKSAEKTAQETSSPLANNNVAITIKEKQ
ncbi:MAG: RNA methyltransferase [Candidatus Cloacimonas sp.]